MLKSHGRLRLAVIASAAASCLALSAGASHAAPAAKAPAAKGPAATVRQFIDAFDKGDMKAAEATHISAPSIVDEPPPHVWSGPGAFMAWAGDLQKDATAHEQSDSKVTLGKVSRQQIDGDTAYVVLPATYSYKEKGVAMTESAKMAFALKKDAGAWKIAGWAWAGTVPHPAAAAAPAAPAAGDKPKP